MIFDYVVFSFLALLLFLATGAAIYLGIFKSGRQGTGKVKKVTTAIVSYCISAVFWYFAYGHHYIGW